MKKDIMQYESTIWATADSLMGAGIKQSDFPKFMMPFFALMMVESRLLRMAEEVKDELDKAMGDFSNDDFSEAIKDEGKGYNSSLLRKNKALRDICLNDKTFEPDFDEYLRSFDEETRDLLGIDKSNEEEKYLDISGIIGQLKKKKILFPFVRGWAEIDLKPFNNSEITTLEEHIKRKWADMSAGTAGEQFTPDDVIALISEIVLSKVKKSDRFLTIYDSTCGGGNMLFGVEDRIKEKLGRPTATYGQDWNDALYALAKIESRFRENSHIEYGNTLTTTNFYDKDFDVIVANPPYGISWADFSKDAKGDKSGQFKYYPSESDGQLLFMQHLVSKMSESGIAIEVHNGSALFSGDAGSGESSIRKLIFDNDYIEAIIQLPMDEFFNTNIYTYLWIFNKNKPADKKDKIILIDASQKFRALKKSKGKKRKEVDPVNRAEIVKTLQEFKDNEYSKVFDKAFFYFNKQAIMLTNLDENGKSIKSYLGNKKSLELEPIKITKDNETIFDNFEIKEFSGEFADLKSYNKEFLQTKISELDYKEQNLKIHAKDAVYSFDNDKETIVKTVDGKQEELGCGKIVIKSSYKKATKTQMEKIIITAELTPDYQKDYEIIPFSRDAKINTKNIADFMKKYIFKPVKLLDNVVGVEVNFNKVFYMPEILRPLAVITGEIKTLDAELKILESNLGI